MRAEEKMEQNARLRKKQEEVPQDEVHMRKMRTQRSNLVQTILTRFLPCVFVLVILLKYYPNNFISIKTTSVADTLLHRAGLTKPAFAVIIDAGSTGSRVLAFTFHKNGLSGDLVLDDELWMEVKPGLSSYAGDPKSGGASINQLLEKAKERIPEEYRKDTPVTLKATAGLWLLPQDQAKVLIGEVVEVLANSGFKVVDGDGGVEIMSELNEGVFGWFTVNFLLGKLNNLPESYVALDLGGGSTQISFVPGPKSKESSPAGYLHEIPVKKEMVSVYSHSYLGLGLMAARKAIFTSTSSPGDSTTSLSSPCFTSATPSQWTYQKTTFTISQLSTTLGYESCMEIVEAVIAKVTVDSPMELSGRNIAAFSYFFDRAVDSGMLSPTGFGGQVKVGDFVEAAKKTCKGSKLLLNSPFLCTDLTYIAGLLTKGYNLDLDGKMNIFKKINGHEASWALGAAYGLLN